MGAQLRYSKPAYAQGSGVVLVALIPELKLYSLQRRRTKIVSGKNIMRITSTIPPSIYATIALVTGIATQHATSNDMVMTPRCTLMVLCCLIALTIYSFMRTKKRAYCLLMLLCAPMGAWRYAYVKNSHENLLETITQTPLDLTGIITDITPIQTRNMHKITIQVHTYTKTDLKTTPCSFTIFVYTGKSHTLCAGDTIAIHAAQLKKTTPEFTLYLLKERATCCIFINTQQCTLVSRPTISVYRFINNLRTHLVNSMAQKLSPSTYALFASLFLGNNKTDQHTMDHWSQLLRSWGLSHYLARSGLHLILFIAIWLFILRITPALLIIKQCCLVFLVTAYALMSWPSVSFCRALFTFMLCTWCIMQKRPIHYVHILAIVCFITLLHNPFCLLFLDFQLSYGLTFALGWFNYLAKRRPQIL